MNKEFIVENFMGDKMSTFVLTLVLFCLVFFYKPESSFAQEQNIYQIETIDGNIFIGLLVEEDDRKIVISSEVLGELAIEKTDIKKMTKIDTHRFRDGVYWFENPHATRYFFSTNAIGLKRGHGYYQNTWIFFNNVNIGVTDNISIGGGIIPMFLFGSSATPVWFLPKVSIPIARENIHLAAGAMIGSVVGGDDSGGFGLVYGVSTVGLRDNNLSFGIAYGYAGDDWSDNPVINVSGMARTSRTLYFVSENWFFPGTDFNGIISVGVRWAPEKFAVDFALLRPLEDADGLIGIPWLGVTIPFGR